MTELYPPVHVAWNAVMRSVRSVAKDEYNRQQKFRFRGVDAVINEVGPALREHSVAVVAHRVRQISTTEYESKPKNPDETGTRMVNRLVHVKWRIYGPGGDWLPGESFGESADAGDKSMAKAMSVAYRTFLLQALCIPTGDADPDSESHERRSAAVPPKSPILVAREALWGKCATLGQSAKEAEIRFETEHGYSIKQADPDSIGAFAQMLESEAQMESARDAQEADDQS